MMGTGQWWITAHAARAMVRRGFSRAEVLAAAESPEVCYPGSTGYPGQDHREIRQRGRVAIVVDKETLDIITVLKRECDRWDDQP